MPVSGVFLNVFGDGDHAAETDVRDGTSYNNGNLTGSLDVGSGIVPRYPAEELVIEGTVFGNEPTPSLVGRYRPVAVGDVRLSINFGDTLAFEVGTCHVPNKANVRSNISVDVAPEVGDLVVPGTQDVRELVNYDSPSVPKQGILDLPAVGDVRDSVQFDNNTKTGELVINTEANLPPIESVLEGVSYGDDSQTQLIGVYHAPEQNEVWDQASFGPNSGTDGTNKLPDTTEVKDGVMFGPDSTLRGTLSDDVPDYPATTDVRDQVQFNSGNSTGSLKVPQPEEVLLGVETDDTVGTLDVFVAANLPPNTRVIEGIPFGDGDVGNYKQTVESQVLEGVGFGAGNGAEFTGRLPASGGSDITPVYPSVESVLIGVEFGNVGDVPYVGVYNPAQVEDVKEDVRYGPYDQYYGEYDCSSTPDPCENNWLG